ncbi:MAG: HEAT repeat domain-containing protein [Polyangiaceae bacterium]
MDRAIAWIAGAVMAASVALAGTAAADPRTDYFIKQLKTSDDFKVRTQAALALGASGDDAAVEPLCGALSDSDNSVKVASAAALGKLGKSGGLTCLKSARAKEKNADVIAQMDQSIAKLTGGGGATPPPVTADTKIYVAIEITNKTSRSASEIEGIVRGAIQAKILGNKGYAVAPKGESVEAGGKLIKSKNLKGYLVIAAVEAPSYANGELAVTVNMTMWTFPEKALKAQFAPKFTQENTSSTDTEGENILMKMAAEKATDSFVKVANSL